MGYFYLTLYLPNRTDYFTNDDTLIEHDHRWREAIDIDRSSHSVKIIRPDNAEIIWTNVPFSIQYVDRT